MRKKQQKDREEKVKSVVVGVVGMIFSKLIKHR